MSLTFLVYNIIKKIHKIRKVDLNSTEAKWKTVQCSHQCSFKKSASLMELRCISTYEIGGSEKTPSLMKAFRVPSRWHLFQRGSHVFQRDSVKPHPACITTELIIVESRHWTELSAVRPFTGWEHLMQHEMENMTKKSQEWSSIPLPTTLLSSQLFIDWCEKKRGCHTVATF